MISALENIHKLFC